MINRGGGNCILSRECLGVSSKTNRSRDLVTREEIKDLRLRARSAAYILTDDIHQLIADRGELLKCARALAGQCRGFESIPDTATIADNPPGGIITLGDCRRARDMLRRMGEE
jgi:hypothetical protein